MNKTERLRHIEALMYNLEYQYPHSGVHTYCRCECDRNIQRGYGPCAHCIEAELAGFIGKDKAEFFHRRVRKLSDLFHSILNEVE